MFGIPIFSIIPLFLGLLAACGALSAKRALEEGCSALRLGAWSCVAFGILHLPLLFWAEPPGESAKLYQVMLPGLAFFAAMMMLYAAIQYGEVSIATPLMGTKVLLVVILTALVLGEEVPAPFWIAAFLVLLGVIFMRTAGGDKPKRFLPTLFLALGACSFFAADETMMQAWRFHWGVGLFGPLMMLTAGGLGLLALIFVPRPEAVPSRVGKIWFWAAIGFIGLQTLGFIVCLSLFDHPNAAAIINLTFNSRGLWSIVLVWVVGHWFGNREREQGGRTMTGRLVGALFLFVAIAMTLLTF
jgi:drug/metabolite transporter (DMT)-like permease